MTGNMTGLWTGSMTGLQIVNGLSGLLIVTSLLVVRPGARLGARLLRPAILLARVIFLALAVDSRAAIALLGGIAFVTKVVFVPIFMYRMFGRLSDPALAPGQLGSPGPSSSPVPSCPSASPSSPASSCRALPSQARAGGIARPFLPRPRLYRHAAKPPQAGVRLLPDGKRLAPDTGAARQWSARTRRVGMRLMPFLGGHHCDPRNHDPFQQRTLDARRRPRCVGTAHDPFRPVMLLLLVPLVATAIPLPRRFQRKQVGASPMARILPRSPSSRHRARLGGDRLANGRVFALGGWLYSIRWRRSSWPDRRRRPPHRHLFARLYPPRPRFGHDRPGSICRYYGFFNLFLCTMLFAVMANDIVMMWVGIEATTLGSAFLVGIYGQRASLKPPGNISSSVASAWPSPSTAPC